MFEPSTRFALGAATLGMVAVVLLDMLHPAAPNLALICMSALCLIDLNVERCRRRSRGREKGK